jgi:hypothetical protein
VCVCMCRNYVCVGMNVYKYVRVYAHRVFAKMWELASGQLYIRELERAVIC